MPDPDPNLEISPELLAKMQQIIVPKCCQDLPPPHEIEPGFKLPLRRSVALAEGVPPIQALTFKGLTFDDLDDVDNRAEMSFADLKKLVVKCTGSPKTVIGQLGIEDAQRAMYVVSSFLLPLRQ